MPEGVTDSDIALADADGEMRGSFQRRYGFQISRDSTRDEVALAFGISLGLETLFEDPRAEWHWLNCAEIDGWSGGQIMTHGDRSLLEALNDKLSEARNLR